MAGEAMRSGPIRRKGGSILGMEWAGVHLPGSLNIRLSNWDDANTAIRIGTDPNRPLLDLLADEFLDLGHVGVGFEVPPEGIISQASHRSIQSSTEKGASTEIYVSAVAIGPKASPANLGVVFRKHDRQFQRRDALENQPMSRFRFHIGTLVLVVLLLGIGLAALRESDETWDSGLFSLTLVFLSISILLGLHRTGSSRAFWLGFALFGWIYVGLSLVPSVEPRLITTRALALLDSMVPRSNASGLTYFEYDDGSIDPSVVNNSQPNALFPKKSDGVFQDVTPVAGSNPAGTRGTGSDISFLNIAAGQWLRGSVGKTEHFMRIGHSLVALLVAILGGKLSCFLVSRNPERSSALSSPANGL